MTTAAPSATTRAGRTGMFLVYAVGIVVVVLDQITKALAVANLEGQPKVQVVGDLLQLTFVRNPGAAFGFGVTNTWVFTVFAAVVTVVIIWFSRSVVNLWWALSMGLLLGGAVGIFIDRWIQTPGGGSGHVVDFLELPNWPVFNVADMAVVSGAVLMVALSLFGVDYRPTADEDPDSGGADTAGATDGGADSTGAAVETADGDPDHRP